MKPLLIYWLLVLAIAVPALYSSWGLTESSEARYAEISREMYTAKDYVEPRLLGIHHYHKPPLTYYITSLGYSIFGLNEFGARFFLHVALLFQLLLVYKIAQLLYRNSTLSAAAVLIFFSFPIVQIAANNLTTDEYLTTFIFSSIYFFLKYHQESKTLIYIYLFYIFCGLAFLTKGPVGILPQALFAIIYTKTLKIKNVFNSHTFFALLLCVVICASWFIILLSKNETLLNYFIKHQLADRVGSDAFNRSKPFWYYFAFIPLLGLPAFVYFADYLRKNLLSFRSRKNIAGVLLVTLAILLLIFSASSSKLILYVLPLYLFISIVSAKHLAAVSLKTVKIFEIFSLLFSGILFLGLIAACFIQLPLTFPKMPVLSLSFTGILTIIFCKNVEFKSPYLKPAFINALTMVVLLFLFPFIMKVNELKINSVKPVAAFIKKDSGNKLMGSIVVYDYLLPSLAFYTNEKIITLNNGNATTERETQFESRDSLWQNTYFKLRESKDTFLLKRLLSIPNSYLVAQQKNDLPDSLSFLKRNLSHRVVMGKWVIYF